MKKKRYKFSLLFLVILFGSVFISCHKDRNYPIEPVITFKDYIKYGNDSADFMINFTDGDGDIGLDKADTFPPYDTSSIYYNNIFLHYQYKDSLGYHDFNVSGSPLEYNYRIPVITPFGSDKSLNGEIHVRLFAPVGAHPVFRFRCFIVDRALHESNKIDSPDLTP